MGSGGLLGRCARDQAARRSSTGLSGGGEAGSWSARLDWVQRSVASGGAAGTGAVPPWAGRPFDRRVIDCVPGRQKPRLLGGVCVGYWLRGPDLN